MKLREGDLRIIRSEGGRRALLALGPLPIYRIRSLVIQYGKMAHEKRSFSNSYLVAIGGIRVRI